MEAKVRTAVDLPIDVAQKLADEAGRRQMPKIAVLIEALREHWAREESAAPVGNRR